MSTKFLVLRSNTPLFQPFRDLGLLVPQSGAGSSTRGDSNVDLKVEIATGQPGDAAALRADPTCAAALDAEIKLALVAPKGNAVEGESLAALKQVGDLRMPQGLVAIGAHTSPFTGKGITAAVLDTGIDDTHPAFHGKQLVKRDFSGQGTTPDDVGDTDGHGTHCAATLCGATVDDVRVGVAPGITRLCIGKVLGEAGATLETLVRGMFWAAVEHNAAIISMSLEYDLPGNAKRLIEKGVDPAIATNAAMRQQSDIIKAVSMLRMFFELRSPNIVFAAATGNESARPNFVLDAGLPAAELFAVGALESSGEGDKWKVAQFSNGRAHVVAPGVNVVSAAPGGGWATLSGTSMATPHVAGVAALWLEKLHHDMGGYVPDAVRSAIKSSATRQPLLDSDPSAVGAGLVQAPQ